MSAARETYYREASCFFYPESPFDLFLMNALEDFPK
jgi:hypothetical protein